MKRPLLALAVFLCGSRMSRHGLTDAELIEVAQRSSMDELAKATTAADKLLTARGTRQPWHRELA